VHIVFLEFIIDPACTTVFEAESEEKDLMQRKPRSIQSKLFNRKAAIQSAIQGIVALVLVVVVYLYAKHCRFRRRNSTYNVVRNKLF
jgi:Ca2+-transporting ATPase